MSCSILLFRCSGVKGSITINGHERNLSQFRKLSCYIMQDNQLHANLSVEEAMHVATSLKLGSDISKDSKYQVVSCSTRTVYFLITTPTKINITAEINIAIFRKFNIVFRFKKY